MDNDKLTAARIVFALARKRKWGESHTAYENMFRQFRSQSMGKEGLKHAENNAAILIREGFIIRKPTGYGLQVSLNPRKAQEIKNLIKEQLGFDI